MSTQRAITANPIRNNSGTMLGNGTWSTGAVTKQVTLRDSAIEDGYGSKVVQAVSPDSSGNLGTFNSMTNFAHFSAGQYMIRRHATTINNVADNTLRFGAADFGLRRPIHSWTGYQRLHITSWDYVTGAATTGGEAGTTVQASGIDGTVGRGADDAANPTDAVPGELVYMVTGATPTQDEYKPRTNP